MDSAPTICVFAPSPFLMVEIEEAGGDTQIHLHHGGQGLWVARLAAALGAEVRLCAPFGGEVGPLLLSLDTLQPLTISEVPYDAGNGAIVQDRRGGEPRRVAVMTPGRMDRHVVDGLFGATLVGAMESGVCVVTGAQPADLLNDDVFGRIVRDVRGADVPVVADLSGSAAIAAAAEGPTVLKMSHEELVDAGLADGDGLEELAEAAETLVAEGVGAMVVSRAEDPALLVTADGVSEVVVPNLTEVDHRGAGDSMTAAVAVGLASGRSIEEAVRLGAAAGTLNVTRHGLGTGERDQIEQFADHVEIRRL